MLAEIYGLTIAAGERSRSLGDEFTRHVGPRVHAGDTMQIGPIMLIAHAVAGGRVTQIGLQLAEPDRPPARKRLDRLKAALRNAIATLWPP
jgi:NhaP-type Na+/H+ and K+/H+ antiporter